MRFRTGSAIANEILRWYHSELGSLAELALDGQIGQSLFIAEAERITAEAMRQVYLSGGGDIANLSNSLGRQLGINRASVRNLADDIFTGRYSAILPEEVVPGRVAQTAAQGAKKLLNRVNLWSNKMAENHTVGQMNAPHRAVQVPGRGVVLAEPFYTWERGPTADSCADCSFFDGRTLPVSQWARLPKPRSAELACSGFKCQCRFVEAKVTDVISLAERTATIEL